MVRIPERINATFTNVAAKIRAKLNGRTSRRHIAKSPVIAEQLDLIVLLSESTMASLYPQ